MVFGDEKSASVDNKSLICLKALTIGDKVSPIGDKKSALVFDVSTIG